MITLPKRIDLFKMLPAGALVAEIGVWRGYLSIEVLNECPKIAKLYLVDAWKPQPAYNDHLSDTDHEENLRLTKQHCRGHRSRWEIVRGDSLDVAANDKTIPPLHAAYIDANHSYEACLADLIAWSKRLRPDGVLLGHDHTDSHPNAIRWGFGVVKAVSDFCRDYGWVHTHLTAEDFPSFRLERK